MYDLEDWEIKQKITDIITTIIITIAIVITTTALIIATNKYTEKSINEMKSYVETQKEQTEILKDLEIKLNLKGE